MIFRIESRYIKNKATRETKSTYFHCVSGSDPDRRDVFIGTKNIAVTISAGGGCCVLLGYGTVSGCGKLQICGPHLCSLGQTKGRLGEAAEPGT